MNAQFPTPFELGNGNQTTTWQACIAYYQDLAQRYPGILKFEQIGVSDAGYPMHAGIISADGEFNREKIKQENRVVFFNNNGIHPGEPEGVDACMALVRDFCTQAEKLASLGQTVFLFIPLYNVDGANNRANTSRVNQDGPEQFGFRGNHLHLDLNRDFIKCDSQAAQTFNRFFSAWSPDVMVDTHTSNGADYQYTMTLIPTQADKLGGALGAYLREQMLPAIYQQMAERGWPTCPYVNPVKEIPDDGIADFLEVPRFSTGYAALHHTIGFMPETHMLKPYADRYQAMRALVETVLAFTLQHGKQIQQLRQQARQQIHAGQPQPVLWEIDMDRPDSFLFKGYQAAYKPSTLGNYQRLYYDRSQPYEKSIPFFNRAKVVKHVVAPRAYLIPQAWRTVLERLQANGVQMQRLEQAQYFGVECYQAESQRARAHAYEGHMFFDELEFSVHQQNLSFAVGDYYIPLDQPAARYLIETLEPWGHDSFFRWGFFNSILEKKEAYSDYVFEDTAAHLLVTDLALAQKFSEWKLLNPEKLNQQSAILDFVFHNTSAYREPEWRRYPVCRLV